MKAKRLVLIAFFGLLTFLASFISFSVGPVPFSLQTLFVILTALCLVPKDAFFAMIIHMLLKFLLTGAQTIVSPSFGFVLGFILAASLGASYLVRSKQTKKDYIIATVIASILPYLVGLPYMAVATGLASSQGIEIFKILKSGLLIFIPGDIVKAIIAYMVARRLEGFFKSYKSEIDS